MKWLLELQVYKIDMFFKRVKIEDKNNIYEIVFATYVKKLEKDKIYINKL